jgi:excisionase family DNA binding protein
MSSTHAQNPTSSNADHLSTIEVAQMLGLAVRSVQLMVDRGEIQAWKTSGGHRRISRESVVQWLASRQGNKFSDTPGSNDTSPHSESSNRYKILLIEDSTHFQNLVQLLINQHFPTASLHMASDGIAGLAMFGQIQPDCLLVDILLPGIDGATLITKLRSDPLFASCNLMIVTGLTAEQLEPYAFALKGLPLIHKTQLALDLIPQLLQVMTQQAAA